MKLLQIVARWLNSLAARITFFIIAALIAAQVIGVLVFARDQEHLRSEQVSEQFLRQMAGLAELFNGAQGINRPEYLRSVTSPGLNYWISSEPAVRSNIKPASDWPTIPENWNQIHSSDKRLIWYPDTRPLSARYTIAPVPLMRNLPPLGDVKSQAQINGSIPPDALSAYARTNRPPPGAPPPPPQPDGRPPPRFGPPPPGAPAADGSFTPPDLNEAAADGIRADSLSYSPDRPRMPPPNRPPVPIPVRWRASVALEDGTWLNGEHMYEAGLAPWLRTVLYENTVILVLMILLVVPLMSLATLRLSRLARAADRLGRGEDTDFLPESGSSEIRHLTQAFNNMSLRLRRFVQGRTQMLAGISHDLRTPITALRLRADLVDDEENRDRMQALIDDMQHLTEATLTLAKDESYTEKSDRVDISSLIEAICDDLTDAGIDVSANVERGVSLTCRPHSLRRAIRNVAENGAKYGKRARIRMHEDARTVRIIVDDDGPGIPHDQRDKAFQPFVRLEGSRSRETGGSGLGLAITRSIVLNHGGEIALTNRDEGGLRVTLSLPKGEDG